MKRLFELQRTLSPSLTSDVVSQATPAPPRPIQQAVQGETDSKMHLRGVAMATIARSSANRLLELVAKLARAEIWRNMEVLELYQRCSGFVGTLEQEITCQHKELSRLRGLDCSHEHDFKPSPLGDAEPALLKVLRATIPLVHSAMEACAHRVSDMNDPEIMRIFDDCRVAYDHAGQLRRELGKYGERPHENANATKPAVAGCLQSRNLLRTRLFVVQDSIAMQSLFKAAGMTELITDTLVTPEERILDTIQVAINHIDSALADWMRRGPVASSLSPELPAIPLAEGLSHGGTFSAELPAKQFMFSTGSPASLLSSLPPTPGGIGDSSHSAGRDENSFPVTPLTSSAPPTPALEPAKLPTVGMLACSEDECLPIPSTVSEHRLAQDTGHVAEHWTRLKQTVYHLPTVTPLHHRDSPRRRQLSLPLIWTGTESQSRNTTAPTVRQDPKLSSQRRLIIHDRGLSSLGDLSETLRANGDELCDSPSVSQSLAASALLNIDPSASSTYIDLCTPRGTEVLGGLTGDFASGCPKSPDGIPSALVSASLKPATNGELPCSLISEHRLLEEHHDLSAGPFAWAHCDWRYPAHMPGNISLDTTPLEALDDLSLNRAQCSSQLANTIPATLEKTVARDTSIDFDNEWGFCRDLTDSIFDMASRPQGFGGLSDVYSASWCSHNKTVKVAVKVVRTHGRKHEKTLRRLRREIMVWQKLEHPHVLPLCGIHFGVGDFPSLVSPWCEHGDICTYLSSRAGEPELLNLKLLLLTQTLDGLQYLHSYIPEIVHGDLKGANILVSSNHKAQLCDFGFASMKLDKGGSMFNSSAAKGTWRWMAPELLSDDNARHTKASDIWAYGCLLVEVLSGKVPFHEKVKDLPVIIAIARGEHPSRPADTHDDLWDLMISCWALDANERPPAEFVAEQLRIIRASL